MKIELMLKIEDSDFYKRFVEVGECDFWVDDVTAFGTIILNGERIPIRITKIKKP